ncbi:YdcF family protein [Paenibacillus sp. ACRRX]|uniref:YdcF family protein n=1 Tax=Paenibacillus sp. ACRRX TaxID=2918206 RepID=UPI001EF62712|nr:YdcF family protein [Paenibacillus sp. ACRRX]MCG7407116.1 YdcF family protein [Paenibacillus sp. ACRRX]
MYAIMWLVPIVLLVLFLWFYLRDPRRTINGFLFNILICSTGLLGISAAFLSGNPFLMILAIVPIILFGLMLTFGGYALVIALLLNAKILIRKEGRKFSNYLTLLLGICILIFITFSFMKPVRYLPQEIQLFYSGVMFILLYFLVNLFSFLSAYFLYQFNKPKLNQNFIIVLGSGLMGDKVPPLLANRIDKAIEFYRRQEAVTTPPTLILSGGKGSDELVSEAEAMQAYAVDKGIPIQHTIQENRSTNTFENMVFSKKIMDNMYEDRYNSIFATNNFHLFRSGLFARAAGLSSQGIGAKTALYYWPNAMIREYIAVVVMNKKRHGTVVGIVLGLSLIGMTILYITK